MSSSAAQLEIQTQCAVEDVRLNGLSIRKAAEKWNVGRERLRGRMNGVKSGQTRVQVHRKLDLAMEEALLWYCRHLDNIGISARLRTIRISAQQLLESAHTGSGTPATLGKNWVRRFLERHPEAVRIRQKPLGIKRVVVHELHVLFTYFRKLQGTIRQFSIQIQDLWNYDEIGFRVGIGGAHWIITMEPDKAKFIASDTNRDSVTCCEAVNAAGDCIEPMVILPAANIYTSFIQNDLPDKTLLATSSEGYIDDILALKWLKHFDLSTGKCQVGTHRLLLLDGHGSHLTYNFIKYAHDNKIVIFQLPPHSTHLLQPLDLLVFQPYKHWHREAVDAATRTGCTNFNKAEFLASLRSIRQQAFKPSTIRNAWRLAGIVPDNPQVVLNALRAEYRVAEDDHHQNSDHDSTSTPHASSPPRTPKTIRSLQRSANRLLNGPDNSPVSPTLDRFVRASLAQAHTLALLQRDMAQPTAERQARTERQRSARRILSSGGVVYAEEARRIEATRVQTELMNQQAATLKRDRIARDHEAAAARLRREEGQELRLDERKCTANAVM